MRPARDFSCKPQDAAAESHRLQLLFYNDTIASENGYTVDKDILTGTTKIYTPDLMEIEFLIEQKGAARESVLDTNIGVSAQALHHVSLLKTYSMP